MPDYDVVVLGGGPGGYAAALYGAGIGLSVAVVDERRPGGTCLHVGCIPAKELLQTAEVFRAVAGAKQFGIVTNPPEIQWGDAIARKDAIVERLVKGLEGLLKGRKVTVVQARGRVSGRSTIATEQGDVSGRHLIVAAGSQPKTIPGFDFDGDVIIHSDHALSFPELPASIAVIGAAAVGAEFASLLADLGTEVTLLEALPQVLPVAEPDCARALDRALKKRGVTIATGVKVTGWEKSEAGAVVTYEAKETARAEVEKVLVATGRGASTRDIGLEDAGVEVDQRGFVTIDRSNMRTTAEGVWAVGDCVATPGLAHVAFAEAMVAIRDIVGEDPQPVDYDKVPFVVYTHPEVAWVGLTEAQAKEVGHEIEVHRHNFGGVGRAMIIGEAEGFVKVVAAKDGGPLLGVHIAGPWASELVAEAHLAVNWEATGADVGHYTHAHPTLSEALGEAALAFTGRSLHG